MKKRIPALLLAGMMSLSMTSCGSSTTQTQSTDQKDSETETTTQTDHTEIEEKLNLANMDGQKWKYDKDADAWVMSVVTAVVNPEIEEKQGVSVCVPGAYVKGLDTDKDKKVDKKKGKCTEETAGALVIDNTKTVTSTNGQEYTADTAPIILNTGAAGYGSSENTEAATTYAAEGYINVACGNRGKQDSIEDEDGNTVYTGDAPCCLVDQKNAIRFVRYNCLLGNLPGNVEYVVSTGGSGGGAHATMFAATGDNPDFYDYEIDAGAVGIYKDEKGNYETSILIDDEQKEISDGAWGCMAYSAITPLAEADMAMAFEYYLDSTYEFNSDFQKKLAEYLSKEYMNYINDQNLSVEESAIGMDVDRNGKMDDVVKLNIRYDEKKYKDTNGYGGTYVDLYRAHFRSSLQWYLDNLDYAEGWTWFDKDGKALSNKKVKKMTTEDKAKAFLEGRYAKSESEQKGGNGGPPSGGPGEGGEGGPDGQGGPPSGGGPGGDNNSDSKSDAKSDDSASDTKSDDSSSDAKSDDSASDTKSKDSSSDSTSKDSDKDSDSSVANESVKENSSGDEMEVGTPDAGTTQSAGSGTDSANYETYSDMIKEYESDINEIKKGDAHGKNIVDLYNPLNYIGAKDTKNPTWVRILMGASEGDMSMFDSMNMQLKFLDAGTNCKIDWQWDGGHVPSEILGDSLPLYVDQMYGMYVENSKMIEKPKASAQKKNGDADEATGTDISDWVNSKNIKAVDMKLKDIAAYRTAGASKAIPGFDVIDYGQEDYVFGSSEKDARHWDEVVLGVMKEQQETLEELFNANASTEEEE